MRNGVRQRFAGGAALALFALVALPGCADGNQASAARPTPESAQGAPAAGARAPETTSLLGRPLFAQPGGDVARLEAQLAEARAALAADPDNPEKLIWVGRRLGYLWRMNEAVAVYSDGIRRFPEYVPLYRHRGHRLISLRRFDEAAADLTKAAVLLRAQESLPASEQIVHADAVEPDGMPNARNIPLTTLGFNVWYHLGVAKYLNGDFRGAMDAFREALKHTGGHDDNLVAASDWLYLSLRRARRSAGAQRALQPITPGMEIIENKAYHRRLLLYKGLIQPEALFEADGEALDEATLGYGLGAWRLCNGDVTAARAAFERVVAGPVWPAFGYIAAEAELARLGGGEGSR